jgi:hypothetical protein
LLGHETGLFYCFQHSTYKNSSYFNCLLFALTGCTIQKPPVPVGIFPKELPKEPDPDASAAQVPAGYKVEVFMKDLVWPTSIDFDESGNAYVAEAGYAYRTSGNVESLTFLSIIVTFCKTA